MDNFDDIESPPKSRSWFHEILQGWVPAILAVVVIRAFLFEPFRIPSGSMLPTLEVGDFVVVSKYSYGLWLHVPFPERLQVKSVELLDLGDPDRGDVIVFRYPKHEGYAYIKRVVAIPGDRIRVEKNQVYLNGEKVPRQYISRHEFTDADCLKHPSELYVEDLNGLLHFKLTEPRSSRSIPVGQEEIEVPPDSVFVMGDNRDNSQDSRFWGFVRYDQIKGKAQATWLSLEQCAPGGGISIRTERAFKSLYTPPQG